MRSRGLYPCGSAILAAAVLAGCSTTTPTLAPSTAPTSGATAQTSQLPGRAAPCDPSQLSLSPGGWGGAGGTTFVILHVRLASGQPCLIPVGPPIDLLDSSGRVIASGPSRDPTTVVLATTIDLRMGWSSWCGSAPPRPLRARLHVGSGQSEVVLPSGVLASCQGVPTQIYVEPVQPVGT